MAIVNIQMYPGRTVEQKRALTNAIADALSEHAGCMRERVYVTIQELPVENWNVHGTYGLDDEKSQKYLKP
ncbi:4-oxalocrotonate tautomerase family protein [Devosia sp. 2618]|uniref:tautomerase family protein n=1 Tax=Devosia sp. 2618 TaxID=3156454 RepID=UPI003391D69F